jgi:hypothetical protein
MKKLRVNFRTYKKVFSFLQQLKEQLGLNRTQVIEEAIINYALEHQIATKEDFLWIASKRTNRFNVGTKKEVVGTIKKANIEGVQ